VGTAPILVFRIGTSLRAPKMRMLCPEGMSFPNAASVNGTACKLQINNALTVPTTQPF